MNYWLIAFYGHGYYHNEVHQGALLEWFNRDNHIIEGDVQDVIVGAWPITAAEYHEWNRLA
jgi:hypothetical protein